MENLIGKKIRERLKTLKQKQVWLAEQVGVSRMSVSDWIKTGKISIDKAVKVALALEITLDELLANKNAPMPQPPRDETPPQPPEEKLHLVYVDDDELELLIRLRAAPDNLRAMDR